MDNLACNTIGNAAVFMSQVGHFVTDDHMTIAALLLLQPKDR
jgi:hypothetical protein